MKHHFFIERIFITSGIIFLLFGIGLLLLFFHDISSSGGGMFTEITLCSIGAIPLFLGGGLMGLGLRWNSKISFISFLLCGLSLMILLAYILLLSGIYFNMLFLGGYL